MLLRQCEGRDHPFLLHVSQKPTASNAYIQPFSYKPHLHVTPTHQFARRRVLQNSPRNLPNTSKSNRHPTVILRAKQTTRISSIPHIIMNGCEGSLALLACLLVYSCSLASAAALCSFACLRLQPHLPSACLLPQLHALQSLCLYHSTLTRASVLIPARSPDPLLSSWYSL